MTYHNKIQNMDVKELAEFLLVNTVYEDVDFDYDENAYTTTHETYATPFATYDCWWSRDEVVADTVRILTSEVNSENTKW